ncbi:ABC transporter substrate-binding protein [[Haemophilus] ducreyi]|uniref:Peptide transport periplasmic protein n=2 Tax=Haemophilus ducreyi TaxID=730 RepID=F6KUJ0_HAEDC|nr:ABC transporter substrate-binding protein [[Haemophilus] ducreyi]AEG73864.1 peptide transport periplasmic protein [[Haemophilus] ducreyi HMC112]AEG73863.1 peptide transport periplasmic protein [[Haemophilus] ducreyi]AEG73865.1 peptide transport periplasmic protein [[Haemophilus] ducreyi]AEG73866.1 peptide transport periplasmic protein [[Haemophilus] ducreyi]AKO45489.1 peptide ABC transporter substrate-binding protein [[Haemophilus] ducreyi]
MKILALSILKFSPFFAVFCWISTAYAAPRVPKELSADSLIYCTSISGLSFNPQKADVGTNMNVVTEQIYDKLFEIDRHTHRVIPSLAETFSVSDDGKEITLNLRRQVAFHKTPWFTPTRLFNAEDVVFSLNRMIGNVEELPALDFNEDSKEQFQQNQRYAYHFKANLAHYPYFESVALKKKIVKISAPNEYTVKIHLVAPDNSVLAHLASQYAVILSKEYALLLNADENLAQLDLLPVGTGVYQLSDYIQNEYVRLKPNPVYWGEKAKINNVVVDFSSNSTGRMAKYLNQECDIVAQPEPSQRRVISSYEIVESPGANLAFLAFNMQKEKMQDIAFRRQIAQAINRERLVKALFYGSAEVADNVLPSALFAQKNPAAYPYKAPQPRAKNAKLDRLIFWVLDESRVYNLHPLKMAEMIRNDLKKINIDAIIRPVSRAKVVQLAAAGKADYDLILTGWLANNLDPNAFLSPILSCRTQNKVTNLANWCHQQFDEWLEIAKANQVPYVRNMIDKQTQALLEEQLPILPLLHAQRSLFVNQKIKNAHIEPFGQVRLSELTLHQE